MSTSEPVNNPLIPKDDNSTPNPPAATSGDGIDRDSLDDFAKGVIAEFEQTTLEGDKDEGGDGAGAGAGETEDEDTGGEAGTEGSTEEPGAPASTGQEGSESAGGTDTPPEGPEGSQAPPGAPADEPATYLGRPRQDVEAALQTLDYFRSLPGTALDGINAYLSGDYVLVPRDQVPTGATPSSGGAGSASSDDDDLEDLDPAVARRMQRLEEELNGLRQTAQQQAQQQVHTQEQQLVQALDTVGKRFQAEHGLTDEEMQALFNRGAQMETIVVGVRAYPTDPDKAVATALDLAYFSDDTLRQREIDRRAEERMQEQRALAARKTRAGAVTAASGNVAKPTPIAPSKMTAAQREAAIAEELAAAMTDR